ncbi:hypothetical protein [Streptosporangium sp. NBC_01469]|uniref:hypothetical protein n=1 Tax=Streptosporangium sp. NBC_01469 TaxID=2903898 RepID=UPI002E2C6BB3|nr:hypothetical protein [Streptosporangium sp. NBC_01469]
MVAGSVSRPVRWLTAVGGLSAESSRSAIRAKIVPVYAEPGTSNARDPGAGGVETAAT